MIDTAASFDLFGGSETITEIGNPFASHTEMFAEQNEKTTTGVDAIFDAILSVNKISTLNSSSMASAARAVSSAVRAAISMAVETLSAIIKNSLKMAVFKFAIEMCAMGIKSLVEAMLGMSMTPPNIDTQGVFYNIKNAGVSPVTSQPSSQPRYDNPFGNPFGSPSW
jgi:hypothetical protein